MPKKKQKKHLPYTLEDVQEMQEKLNKDLQKKQRNHKNHIPLSLEKTISYFSRVPFQKTK